MIQKIEILIEFVQCCEPRNNAKSCQFGFSLLLLCSETNINQIFLLVSYNTCWPHNWISSYVITSSVVEAAEHNERTLSSIRARITMKSAKKLIISIWMKKYCDEIRVVDVIPRVCMSLYGGFAELRDQAGVFVVACYHATVLGLTLFAPTSNDRPSMRSNLFWILCLLIRVLSIKARSILKRNLKFAYIWLYDVFCG